MRRKTNRRLILVMLLGVALGVAGCIGPQGQRQDTTTYLLSAALPVRSGGTPSALTVLVTPTRARPGFDTPRMAYVREANRIDYYAYHRWVEAPARLLTPLVAQALEASGAFGAVVQAPASAHAQLRLDTELVNLAQDFDTTPSRIRLAVRAQLVDAETQTVRATRTFDAQAPTASEDAPGGAAAANRVLPGMLTQLADWAAQASVNRP